MSTLFIGCAREPIGETVRQGVFDTHENILLNAPFVSESTFGSAYHNIVVLATQQPVLPLPCSAMIPAHNVQSTVTSRSLHDRSSIPVSRSGNSRRLSSNMNGPIPSSHPYCSRFRTLFMGNVTLTYSDIEGVDPVAFTSGVFTAVDGTASFNSGSWFGSDFTNGAFLLPLCPVSFHIRTGDYVRVDYMALDRVRYEQLRMLVCGWIQTPFSRVDSVPVKVNRVSSTSTTD